MGEPEKETGRQKMTPFIQTPRRKILLKSTPLWMAIVNATPDSFSDGGRDDILGHAMTLVGQGADILDIGGESTRPGSDAVSVTEEIERVAPVICGIFRECKKRGIDPPPLSIDTRNVETARAAVALGAEILNDITGGEQPGMRQLARESGAAICFMHMRGEPKTMQDAPVYADVVAEVFAYLARQRDMLVADGIPRESLIADPGIGFGKTAEHNLEILRNIGKFKELGVPLLVGHSRKRFLAAIDSDRDFATQLVSRDLAAAGVAILRLHEKPDFI